MPNPKVTIRAGHPDFLELPWSSPLPTWEIPQLIELPKGISRHTVRFIETPAGLYAIKELPERAARNDYQVLRQLEDLEAPAVTPVGLITNRSSDRHDEAAAALITSYESFAFSYRELLSGPGFGGNRSRMLDAFAHLLVELHLLNCFWGDCSLSNVLYRWDADAIETLMVDAETAAVYSDGLTDGKRTEDIAIMVENVAGGMADIAAQAGSGLDQADLSLGEEIADRYHELWRELKKVEVIDLDDRFRIAERMERINALGFDVEEVDVVPHDDGDRLRFRLRVGSRTFYSHRLRDLAGIEALENQARQILSDLYYYQARSGSASSTGKHVAAVRWRVAEFEPTMEAISKIDGIGDPIQAYCDMLHHRYLMAVERGVDVSTAEALEHWVSAGQPGFPEPD